MHSTKIVTSFIKNDDKLLLLKRSNNVKTMRGLWAGISGIIEKNETPLSRAKIEIYEEVGISEDKLDLIKSAAELRINSPQYENHEWNIFPFLFKSRDLEIKLNWENSEYRWIKFDELKNYDTVPSLERVLFCLL